MARFGAPRAGPGDASDILGSVAWRAPSRAIAGAACLWLLPVAALCAEEIGAPDDDAPPAAAAFADRFAASYVLLEHSGSVGHGTDLSPSATFAFVQSWSFSLAFDADERLSFGVDLGVDTELTTTDTTYATEPMLGDLDVGAAVVLPMPTAVEDVLAWQLGLTASLPTSKASQASSLILALEPQLTGSVTAPILDGLSFGYTVGAIPYVHRYTTSSTLTPRPCSPAAGCDLGRTTDTGGRNTAFQLRVGADLALAAWKERLTIGVGIEGLYSWLYAASPSPIWSEETLRDPGNGDGSPVTVTTEFTAEVAIHPQPGLALAVGLWTPGGLQPDGTGYYNPIGNRFSTVYLDLTFYPVAGIAQEVRRRQKRARATEPVPAEPVPAEPVPAEPVPAEPLPAEPGPDEPLPAEPGPDEPLPAEPGPDEPLPAEPATP